MIEVKPITKNNLPLLIGIEHRFSLYTKRDENMNVYSHI